MTFANLFLGALLAMTNPSLPQPVPFEPGRWRWHATEHRVVDHLGRRSLYLKGGIALVDGARFADGAIEFDVAFTGERGFMGGVWRVQDPGNYEEFYLRPHQSGNPDATQYAPVFHGISGWQLYHGERYAVPVAHRFDEWIHVRIVFAGTRAEIHVGDPAKPVLVVEDLKRDVAAGGVGLSASDFAPAYFSNFSYTAAGSPAAPARPRQEGPVPPGAVPAWSVSDPFPERALEGRDVLSPGDLAARRWTRLAAERSGLANLARLQGIEADRNTVFVRCVLVSGRAQTKRLDFGFSDRVRVFLNGRLLFRGDDTYRSRDYRFLGSIGFYDSLYLPLAEGGNELVLAVSEEDLGGWGVQAKLADLADLTLKE